MPVVFAIIGEMCLMSPLGLVAAVMALIKFLCYLRPGELLDCAPADLVARLGSLGPALRHWGLVIRPQEVGHSTKTGEFDKSVLFDMADFEWLAKPLQRLKHLRSSQPLLWPLSLEE